MNNKLLNILTGKERKRFKLIMSLIEQKQYSKLYIMDDIGDFELTNQKYINEIIEKIKLEVINNREFLIHMYNYNYHRFDYFFEYAIKNEPHIIESFIEKDIVNNELILIALNNGYNPPSEYIDDNFNNFTNIEIIKRLFNLGYKPSKETIEKNISFLSSDEELLKNILDLGYTPTFEIIEEYNLLKYESLVEEILNRIDITEENINSKIFLGNAIAQRKIIKEKPELLLKLDGNKETYETFWIEAFNLGYINEEVLKKYKITNSYKLFSRIIKQNPEMIKYCDVYEQLEKEKLDELSLSLGYVPSITDVQTSEYIRKSVKLMEAVIKHRPEAIKYVEVIPKEGVHPGYQREKNFSDFTNLCNLALDNGYIATEEDIKKYPVLTNSFEIMKTLIEENPKLINSINEYTPRKEELLSIAIENGFEGIIEPEQRENHSMFRDADSLVASETAILYELDQKGKLNNKIEYKDNYSLTLYNCLIEKGYNIEDIITLFTGNFETMKVILKTNPEYISKLSNELSRKQIDELGMYAIEEGHYEPKFEDDIFGYGIETAKYMVKKYPSYLEKVRLFDPFGFLSAKICEGYHEICKISVDGGFLPDVETMGNGYGGMTTTKYNYSYDIMKKAIPLKPSLIESCEVEDKIEYDELCRLAIKHKYEVTNEYALTHWGDKMCTNYDLMAIYLVNNPKFIVKLEISESEEMKKLIDIAIDSGLELEKLSQNQLLKLFSVVDESLWPTYLEYETIEALKKAMQLYENNDEIHKTIDPKFLSDNIREHFTKVQIEILSCYPKLQEKIIKISSDKEKSNLIYELANEYKDNLEWIPILETALENITSSEFTNLLSSIKSKELTLEEKENLMYLLITDNHLDIGTYEELKNIDTIREDYIKMLIERNTLGSLKSAYFEKTFGIDLKAAINLVKLYGKSLESDTIDSLDEKDKAEFIILENMKKIINLNNIEVLRYYVENVNPEFVIKPDLMVTYEARLKYLFTKEFNKSFTKTNEEDKVISSEIGEEDFDIYLAAGKDGKKKCRMMITSIGAYTNMEEPDDYYASWNVDKIASHGCCCSYVGEKNLGTAEVKYCCLGFTDYELGSLQLSGPYDLCSTSKTDSYQITAMYSSTFLLPDDVLSHTRHTHNETVWERRSIGEDGMFKKQPSYIVYFVDNFEDRLTNPEAMKQWESAKKAASNFMIEIDGVKRPLPIMVVEREKIAKSQLEIIETNLKEFKETLNPKLINQIISDYESNYAGNREYHINISEKYFPKHEILKDSVVGKIIEIIKNVYETEPTKAINCIYEIEKTLRNEQEKYNNTQHGVGQSLPSFNIEEAISIINTLKSKFKINKDSIINIINNSKENNIQYEKQDKLNLEQELIESQLTTDNIITLLKEKELLAPLTIYENEIKEENINSKLKINGERHIKNVLLYSILIGQSVIKDKHDLELIMLSAKYHDIGRKTDAYEEHATLSKEIALAKLKDKYTTEDLSVISTIIEFHETRKNVSNIDDIFNEIAKKNGIPEKQIPKVRKMAEVLRDADALDRTRFVNKARLNSEFLEYNFSKQLIKFAASMQETYALHDLKEFNCDEEISILLDSFTPQEVLRTIRHSTKGKVRMEEIQNFIITWANSIKKESLDSDDGVKYGK